MAAAGLAGLGWQAQQVLNRFRSKKLYDDPLTTEMLMNVFIGLGSIGVSFLRAAKARGSVQFRSKLSTQKQMRHLRGTAAPNRSYFDSIDDAQAVLDAYNSGNYKLISQNPAQNTVTIEVKNITGRYVNIDNPKGLPDLNLPTNKFMIQSSKAPKVVPVNPYK